MKYNGLVLHTTKEKKKKNCCNNKPFLFWLFIKTIFAQISFYKFCNVLPINFQLVTGLKKVAFIAKIKKHTKGTGERQKEGSKEKKRDRNEIRCVKEQLMIYSIVGTQFIDVL